MQTVDRRVLAWQSLSVGDLVRFGPAEKGYPTQKVIRVEPNHMIVWQGVDAKTLEVMNAVNAVVTDVLNVLPNGHTRLIVRSRMAYSPTVVMTLLWRITEVLNYVMEQKMLRSIKAYAERDAQLMQEAMAVA